MKVLSVVCARAGSKGLKNKCTLKIDNKMVIEYAIEYSLSLGKNVSTVVSTDIEKVIDYCKKNNIDFIRRNSKLCTDESRIYEVLADAIEKRGGDYEYCSLVYGNIPTRYVRLWHKAMRFLERNQNYDAVISMQDVEKFHPEWMFDYNEELLPKEKAADYRRQMLPRKMIHDGHALIFKIDGYYKRFKGLIKYDSKYKYSIFGTKIKPLINNEVIIDIDTLKDFKLAEAMIMNLRRPTR